MEKAIETLKAGVPDPLEELKSLGKTLTERRKDILAYFDHPGTSNGPTENTNGHLGHLRGIALGFRNLTNYTVRSLIHAGGFRDQLLHTPKREEPPTPWPGAQNPPSCRHHCS